MKKSLLGAATLLLIPATGSANPPHDPDLVSAGNLWTITAFDDTSPVHTQWATQQICFFPIGTVGTHEQYIWVSISFPDWNGIASKEGDQVFMHGDYAQDVGHDGMVWEVVTASKKNVGYGHWFEWREDGRFGRTIGFANARLERIGKCPWDSADEALEKSFDLEYPTDENGREILDPRGNADIK